MKTKSNFKNRLLATMFSVGLALVLIISLGSYLLSYHQTNASTVEAELTGGLPTIVMFYNPACRDCQKVERYTKQLTYTSKLNPKVSEIQHVYLNVNSKLGKKYVQQFGITETPTYILVKKNQVVGSYAGTDKTKIKNLYLNYTNQN